MEKRERFLLSALTFSIGIVFGFLVSPVKKGFGNNVGNITNNYYGTDDEKECGDDSVENS